MTKLLFVTHPDVVVDPDRPVPRWVLSPVGIERMRRFAQSEAVRGVRSVVASTETKAIEAAGLLAAALGLPVSVDPGLCENDRSATGFLPPEAFERMADAFFSEPRSSIGGWERAIDAQARVTAALDRVLARHGEGDIAIVAHGAVGTLLLCGLLGEAIDRRHDQPFQGHVWAASLPERRILHRWQPIAPRL